MKTLLLIRHAEASFLKPQAGDIARELTEKGKKDAKQMAARIREMGIHIDQFICSGANRASKTIAAFNPENRDVVIEPKLFQATEADYFEVILQIPANFDTVAICAHNPGISQFINAITELPFYHMPAGSVFAISINTNTWENFVEAEKKRLFFLSPTEDAGES